MMDRPAPAATRERPAAPAPTHTDSALAAFCGIGIELEYAIVARDSLDVLPIADLLLATGAGAGTGADALAGTGEVARGRYGWSNELVMHVIEIKNLAPAPTLHGVAQGFQAEVAAINSMLQAHHAQLLPGGMHPWMKPAVDTRLWPHAHADIYRRFDRIFDCARHGWSNLQSMHVNLPFSGDEQFARLHAAVRLVLPIIPALAASSPFVDGADSGHADHRMLVYRDNSSRIPEITGAVIPESMGSRAEYEERILAPIYRAIAPHDEAGLLQHEWLNARGAIARFDRSAIEIRVTDTQECPRADMAIADAINAVVRMLYEEETASLAAQQAFDSGTLVDILERCTTRGEQAGLTGTSCAAYLTLLGYPKPNCSAQHLWRHLLRSRTLAPHLDDDSHAPLAHVLEHGTLATRLRRAAHNDPSTARLHSLYGRLARCLAQGSLFGIPRVA